MSKCIHQSERKIVIRLINRYFDNGGTTGYVLIDTDLPSRDLVVGNMEFAKQSVLGGGGKILDQLTVIGLPGVHFDDDVLVYDNEDGPEMDKARE